MASLLFLLYINDLNQAIKFCKVHHFADDTFMLEELYQRTEQTSQCWFKASNWLNANKISLNIKQTEMVIFKSKQNKFEGDLKIKICGKRLYFTESVKYLGAKIDINLR